MASGLAKLTLLIDIQNKLTAGLDSAKEHVLKATGQMQDKFNVFKIKNIEAFDAMKSAIPGLGRALELLVNPYLILASAVVAIGTGLGKSTLKADEWHTKMAEINVTAELSKEKLKDLSDQLLEIGSRNVAPLEEVPKAFNRIISAGLDVETSLATLEPTLRAAKAGFTDIETVASAGTSVMMSSGESATRVYDILFETVKEGNAEFKDIAQYLPKVIPLARNVGFALDETAGAYASLTGKLSTEQSTTALQGVMRALSDQRIALGEISKETGKYVSGFKSIGVNVFDPTTNKIRPLLDIVKDVKKQMEGLSDKERMIKFGKLGLDQSGTLGLSTLMQDIEGLEKAINATTNSAGALEKAYRDSLTPLEDWKIIQNQIKVQMIKIGEIFLPILSAIGKGILWIIEYSDILGGVLLGLAGTWALLNARLVAQGVAFVALKTVTGIATAAQWLYNVALSANPIGAVIMLIGGLIGGLAVAYNRFERFRAVIQGTWEVLKGFGTVIKEYIIDRIKGLLSGLGSIAKAILLLFKGDFSGAWSAAKQGVMDFSGITAGANAFQSTKNLKNTFYNGYNESMRESKLKKEAQEKDDTPDPVNPAVDPLNPKSPTAGGTGDAGGDAKAITSGTQTKSVTIQIGSVIDKYSPENKEINQMSKEEIGEWLLGIMLRVANSV